VKEDIEKWINEVLNSTNGLQRAKAGAFLYPKILNRLKNPAKETAYISKKKVALGFLTILLLGLLNAGAVLYKGDDVYSGNDTKSVIEEYFPSGSSRTLQQIFISK